MRRILLVALSVLFCVSVFAQPMAVNPKLTWVRYVKVDRGREADFMRYISQYTKPMMERLIAQKKVMAWGVAVPITHDEESWTHVVYVSLPDWSGAEAIGQDMEKGDAAMSTADMNRMMQLGSSIHEGSTRDVILRHLVQADMPSTMTPPKYISVDTYVIKPGRERDAVALFNEWAVPIFNDAKAKTMVPLWGLSMQDLPTSAPWTHMVWAFMTDLAGRDALDAAGNALEPQKAMGYEVRLRDMSDGTKMRSQILRLITP